MTLYIGSNGVTQSNYGEWSHTGDEIQLGWLPGGGEIIEVIGVPNVQSYTSEKDEVFGNVPENVSEVVSLAVREWLNSYLCEQMAKKARRKKDEMLVRYWESERQAHEQAYRIAIVQARSRFGNQRHGTEVDMRSVYP